MEKRKPHYWLDAIKTAFGDPDRLNRTVGAADGADDLEMDNTDVVAVIQALTNADFDKSMTSNRTTRYGRTFTSRLRENARYM